jgi:hypothetical protein
MIWIGHIIMLICCMSWKHPFATIFFFAPITISIGDAKLLTLPVHKLPRSHTDDPRNRRFLQSYPIFDDEEDHDALYRGFGTHYVTLYVGCTENPQPQTVIVDTGSSRTGFPCSSCTGECGQGYHLNPLYDESLSPCFEPLTCAECGSSCSTDGQCRASASYAEGSSWRGYLTRDSVRIGNAKEDPVEMVFTCQDRITKLFVTQLADGITGLSKASNSLLNQLYSQGKLDRQQFSLCALNEQTAQSSAGVLVLGGTDVRFHNGPMVFAKELQESSTFWQVRIQGIYGVIGEDVLSTNSSSSNLDGWVTTSLDSISLTNLKPIVDSGTTDTYLHDSFEAPMRAIWEQLTDISFDSFSYTSDEIDQLPTFVFQLEGDIDNPDLPMVLSNDILVAFPPSSYLYPRFGTFRRSFYFDFGRPVLGANWISGHNVLFDLESSRLGFATSDCVLNDSDSYPPTPTPPPTYHSSPVSKTSASPTRLESIHSSSSTRRVLLFHFSIPVLVFALF